MFRGTNHFDRLLDKCTSQMNMETDWSSIMSLCDSIRSGETNPKYAVTQIKKKFNHDNPHVSFFALQVMESCVKNCGSFIHEEIATREFMEEIRELVKSTKDDAMKAKLLEMIQTWGHAFSKSQKYRICTETYNIMKAEGWKFPPVVEADAMFEADTIPAWVDGTVCHRCRVEFGVMTRQHHCRACGQVFCSKCSSKTCSLPKFGIEKEVRVCESCFDTYGPKEVLSPVHKHGRVGGHSEDLPPEYLASSLAQQNQAPPKSGKSEAEIKEEEELQLALALSKSEAEEKEKRKYKGSSSEHYSNNNNSNASSGTDNSSKSKVENEIDPELMRYLDRDFWEMKEKEKAKANGHFQTQQVKEETDKINTVKKKDLSTESDKIILETQKSSDSSTKENQDLQEFITTLKTQVEIFVNRMKSNSSRGRSITNDSSVQTLFMNTMSMHSQLLKYIQTQEDRRVYYEGLQDKLVQVKDARAALDALREEERERKRREAEEAERIRQAQMQEKLEVMRKQKQEFLQYQRQIALQRMQEQEMILRQEQAKHQIYMGNNPTQAPVYGMWPPQGSQPPPSMPYYSQPGSMPRYPDQPYNMQMMGAALPNIGQVPPQQQGQQGTPYSPSAVQQQPPLGNMMHQQNVPGIPTTNPQQPPPPMQASISSPPPVIQGNIPPQLQSVISTPAPTPSLPHQQPPSLPPLQSEKPLEAELISFD